MDFDNYCYNKTNLMNNLDYFDNRYCTHLVYMLGLRRIDCGWSISLCIDYSNNIHHQHNRFDFGMLQYIGRYYKFHLCSRNLLCRHVYHEHNHL